MKKDKENCKKGKESTIGKIIYGFLMFMPLFAIGTTCLISTFNMSAKEEAQPVYKYETNDVNSADDLIIGRAYHFSAHNVAVDTTQRLTFDGDIISIQNFVFADYDDLFIDEAYLSDTGLDYYDLYISINYYERMLECYIIYPCSNNYISTCIQQYSSSVILDFDFVLNYYESNLFDELPYSCFSRCENIPIESIETHNVETQDVFYNAVDKVTTSPLFNWATNSSIYNVINNTCAELSITTTFVPLLLTYWLIISLIYFIYDIVLIILNVLHRKIHELQDSI